MNVLNLIPVWARLLALAVALAVLVLGVNTMLGHARESGKAEVQALWDQAKAQAKIAAQRQALDDSAKLAADHQRNQHETEQAIQKAVDDAHRADAVRLRNVAAAYAARATDHSRAGPDLPTATAPVVVVAGLLGDVDDVAGELAQAADDARARGLSCEREYDSLKQRLGAKAPEPETAGGSGETPSIESTP